MNPVDSDAPNPDPKEYISPPLIKSIIYYDKNPFLGTRTINTLGAIKPMKPPEEREKESALRLEYAGKIIPKVRDIFEKAGVKIQSIGVGGSVGSNMAGTNSDIDLIVDVEDKHFSKLSPAYLKEDSELDRILHDGFTKSFPDGTSYPICVHLNNQYKSPEFIKALSQSDKSFKNFRR